MAVEWWHEVLSEEMAQTVRWGAAESTAQLFCDARGQPARLAAVLFCDDTIYYTSWEPSQQLADTLNSRNDANIMAWELLSVALGVCSFQQLLHGRRVRICSDNVGAESGLRSGSAKRDDHNMIIHALWLHAARNQYSAWVERVATGDNTADLPSRESHQLLEYHSIYIYG